MFKSPILLVALLTSGVHLAAAQEKFTEPAKVSDAASAERKRVEAKPDATLPPPAKRDLKGNAKATPAPTATPAPEKRGFFQRLFGRRAKRVPQATPSPTPKPSTPRPRKPRPAPSSSPQVTTKETGRKPETNAAPDKAASGQPTEVETKGAAAKPVETAAPSAPPAPKKKSGQRTGAAKATPPPDLTTPEAQEKWKYGETRKKAVEDEEIRKLKEKADTAPSDEEGRRALRAYNKALFNKMRSLEPSIKDRIDAMEAGVMKRLGE